MTHHHAGKPTISQCSCKHDYQDKKHGARNRVKNPCKKGNDNGYRCTVCGTVSSN
jgi:hypothetical protein